MRQKRFTTFVSTQTGFNGPVATTLVASLAHRSGETTTKWRRSEVACTCANLFLFGCFGTGKRCTIHLDLVVSFELKILCCCIKGIVLQKILMPKPHILVSNGVFVPLGPRGVLHLRPQGLAQWEGGAAAPRGSIAAPLEVCVATFEVCAAPFEVQGDKL